LNIAWHTDYPFWSLNPFVHLYGFVTRRDVYQGYRTCDPQPWLRDDTLTVDEALSIMTVQSAYALFRETEVGSLAPGKYADLIIISGNPQTVDPEDLRRLSVQATLVGGQVEYCAPGQAAMCPGYATRVPASLPDYRPPVPIRWAGLLILLVVPLGFGAARVRLGAGRAWLVRVGGLAGIVAGAVWPLAAWLTEGDGNEQWAFLYLIAGVAMALAVVGLAALGRPGRLQWVGLAAAFAGALSAGAGYLTLVWFAWDYGWLAWIGGVMAHTLGLALFGLANLRARWLPRLNALPLVVGVISGPVPIVASNLVRGSDWPFLMVVAGLGLGWLAMGALTLAAASAPTTARRLGLGQTVVL